MLIVDNWPFTYSSLWINVKSKWSSNTICNCYRTNLILEFAEKLILFANPKTRPTFPHTTLRLTRKLPPLIFLIAFQLTLKFLIYLKKRPSAKETGFQFSSCFNSLTINRNVILELSGDNKVFEFAHTLVTKVLLVYYVISHYWTFPLCLSAVCLSFSS